jgi:hypothetical protein
MTVDQVTGDGKVMLRKEAVQQLHIASVMTQFAA